jgi:hypothetical protein
MLLQNAVTLLILFLREGELLILFFQLFVHLVVLDVDDGFILPGLELVFEEIVHFL